jgi:hypothetical protein
LVHLNLDDLDREKIKKAVEDIKALFVKKKKGWF